MKVQHTTQPDRIRFLKGFSIPEVFVSLAVLGVTVGGAISGYVVAVERSQWSACSRAASALALQRIEQARAAKWDTLVSTPVDELTTNNFPSVVQPLDLPSSGNNYVYATNLTTITTVSTSPPMRMVRVDCVWPMAAHGVFTNTMIVYRTPDQ